MGAVVWLLPLMGGAALAWLLLQGYLHRTVKEKEELRRQLGLEQERRIVSEQRAIYVETLLSQEKKAFEEKLAESRQSREYLVEAFKAASHDALRANSETFMKLAGTTLEKFQEGARYDLEGRQKAIDSLVKPLKESLEKVDLNLRAIEQTRAQSDASIREQIRGVAVAEAKLTTETSRLVKALRMPSVRGRWGEIQLRRSVELAGMLEHCDFSQQQSLTTEEGSYRPDMVIRLPNGRCIVVDAKTPLQAYLDAMESDEATRGNYLKEHARQVRDQLMKLSAKAYWEQFSPTPEFVVLFLPGESFFSAALEQDSSLIEAGVERKVILATPTTLIALLRTVAYGWQELRIAENAQQISDLGKQLYDRLLVLGSHFVDLRRSLDKSVESYNKVVASMESRVFVAARKFKDFGVTVNEELPSLEPLDKVTRSLSMPVAQEAITV